MLENGHRILLSSLVAAASAIAIQGSAFAADARQGKAIAERWSIPVATTLRAKGVFPEDHELSLGVFGYAGTRHATAAILQDPADVLIVTGERSALDYLTSPLRTALSKGMREE